VDQFLTLDPDSPEGHDYAFTEAAWDWIAIKGWVATPELFFAVKQLARESRPEHIAAYEAQIARGQSTNQAQAHNHPQQEAGLQTRNRPRWHAG
jgi:hypothetical protein